MNLSLVAVATIGIALGCVMAPTKAATLVRPPATRASRLQNQLDSLVRRARPGMLGVAVMDLQSGARWRANAQRSFPMMSVFKAPVAAAVLARIERGELSLDQTVIVRRNELESGVMRDDFHGPQMLFTVRQLLAYAVSKSDNTAVDALLRIIGGPAEVTRFLRAHGIEGMRVDLDEAGFGPVFANLPLHQRPPSGETPEQELARLRRGYAQYLADPRNRSTPDAAVQFLRDLWSEKLLSRRSTQHLLDLMHAQTAPRRLRAGLPAGVRLADKCGTSYTLENKTAAFNDMGILVWPDGHAVIVAAFLSASTSSQAERQAIFADLAREVAAALSR